MVDSRDAPVMRGAVIFDLDGTITRPVIDFDGIRAELGLPPGPILEAMESMDAAQRAHALAVLERHEERAAEASVLQAGAAETIETLRRIGHPVAILTRNARRWTRVVLNKHRVEVDAIRCREDGAIKPSPAPIVDLCREMHASAKRSWMVGDHLFDIVCGREAGASTVLFVADRERPAFADQADHVVSRLADVVHLVTTSHRAG